MLTSGIAHEIKNPLNFINNFAELTVDLTGDLAAEIDRTGDDLDVACLREIAGDLRQNAAKIKEHGQRADRIVEGMLQHSRGRAGEPREVDLNALVREYTSLATSGPAGHKPPGLAVESTLDAGVGVVQLVPEDIGRVLVNLLGNALYATHAKQRSEGAGWRPRVAVSTRALGERVEIRVGDNGTGIPAAIRDKVCMPFFTTKPAGEGTGLGLSISYDIVVQGHGGTLDLESEEGAYTEFRITLPRRAAPAAAGPTSARPHAGST
jgi:signal transduction histidine kinase